MDWLMCADQEVLTHLESDWNIKLSDLTEHLKRTINFLHTRISAIATSCFNGSINLDFCDMFEKKWKWWIGFLKGFSQTV